MAEEVGEEGGRAVDGGGDGAVEMDGDGDEGGDGEEASEVRAHENIEHFFQYLEGSGGEHR